MAFLGPNDLCIIEGVVFYRCPYREVRLYYCANSHVYMIKSVQIIIVRKIIIIVIIMIIIVIILITLLNLKLTNRSV